MAVRPQSVTLVDVCARDGLQNDPNVVSTTQKIALIQRLAAAGLRRIEAVSFVNPKRVPQMADAEAVLAGISDLPGVSLSGLVLNERGFNRALTAGLREISFVAVATDGMAQRNQGTSTEGLIDIWRRISPRAKAAGIFRSVTIAVSFGCPFDGAVSLARVRDIAARLAEAGVDEISLADTIGIAAPAEIEDKFAALTEVAPGIAMRAHLHNTRNTGYANADAAIRSGVRVLDASLGGMGGCPFAPGATGNIATEDLAYMLERSNVATGLLMPALTEAVRWLEGVTGRRLPGHCAHLGLALVAPTHRQTAGGEDK
jgi:hydroxymethylglutaryl-CoA lyase